ncbi:hypothetical protein BST66_01110 [Bradyrhizobium canariense]|nr:hypothetical protein BST66_01110 [Bradyrhizobium canariense]
MEGYGTLRDLLKGFRRQLQLCIRVSARVKDREREARLAEANRAAGTGPRRPPPGVRPRPASPPKPVAEAVEPVPQDDSASR